MGAMFFVIFLTRAIYAITVIDGDGSQKFKYTPHNLQSSSFYSYRSDLSDDHINPNYEFEIYHTNSQKTPQNIEESGSFKPSIHPFRSAEPPHINWYRDIPTAKPKKSRIEEPQGSYATVQYSPKYTETPISTSYSDQKFQNDENILRFFTANMNDLIEKAYYLDRAKPVEQENRIRRKQDASLTEKIEGDPVQFYQNGKKDKKKKEVHYHQHKHLHEHDHKQKHTHKHKNEHDHYHGHKHDQKHSHHHSHENDHKHDHGHHHGHKSGHDHHHNHGHDQKHSHHHSHKKHA